MLCIVQVFAAIFASIAMYSRSTFELDNKFCASNMGGNECYHYEWTWQRFKENWSVTCSDLTYNSKCVTIQGYLFFFLLYFPSFACVVFVFVFVWFGFICCSCMLFFLKKGFA